MPCGYPAGNNKFASYDLVVRQQCIYYYTATSLLHGSLAPWTKPRYIEDRVIMKQAVLLTQNESNVLVSRL